MENRDRDIEGLSFAEWVTSSKGTSGVDYQRSAQITWWSILQGIAVGALVLNLPSVLNTVSQSGKWFLLIYLVISFLIVVNVWVQMAWAILILRWQISIIHTVLILLLGFAVSTVCVFVESPKFWFPSVGALVLSAIAVYIYNIRERAYVGLSTERVYRIIWIYGAFLLLCVIASIHIWNTLTDFAQIFWGVVFLALAIVALLIQDKQMKHERSVRNIL
jgi:hypothetical protein